MTFGNNNRLGGYLVGLGKRRVDGSEEYTVLEKPIHNKIVSTGLDHLLRYNGSNTDTAEASSDSIYAPLWGNGYYSSAHKGVLCYAAFGTGNTATTFNTTTLENMVGSYTSTVKNGKPYTYTELKTFGTYSFYITHQHTAVTNATTVKEVGWFGRYNESSPVYPLFSRVVLDTPVELAEGEQLITTYRLDVTFNTLTETPVDMFGLTATDGKPLKAVCKFVCYGYKNSDSGSSSNSGDTVMVERINNYGDAVWDSSPLRCCNFHHPACSTSYSNSGYITNFLYATKDIPFPADNAQMPYDGWSSSGDSFIECYSTNGNNEQNYSVSVAPYTGFNRTTKYRDVTYTLNTYSPNLSIDATIDIYGLAIMDWMYRFGYYDETNVFHPQALKKGANQTLTFTYRTRFTTEDTTNED